jgi:hypothetical protein
MGLFGFLKKQPDASQKSATSTDQPYKNASTNLIYNLLFCDDLSLYKTNTKEPYTHPFEVLFSDKATTGDLRKLAEDAAIDPRIRVLAYNRLLAKGQKPAEKELLAVIVEVGLDDGLDVLASFKNGTARYINQTGKLLVWETERDETSNRLTNDLFAKSMQIVKRLGPWDQPRRPHPGKGNARITFLVSDGFYFGEGPTDALFGDPMAAPALSSAAQLMQYLTEKAVRTSK